MGGEFFAEQRDEGGVVALEIVGDAQGDERFAGEFGGEVFAEAVGVFALHAEDLVGPAEVAGGDFDAGARFGARGASGVARVIFEERLGGGAAPLVARAEEEEVSFDALEGGGVRGPVVANIHLRRCEALKGGLRIGKAGVGFVNRVDDGDGVGVGDRLELFERNEAIVVNGLKAFVSLVDAAEENRLGLSA